MKKTVYVAMSGGVDSSVAAALLKERGFDVAGVHIKMWSDPAIPCTFKEDRLDAMRVAAKLDIPFETWDLTEEYRDAVVAYMVREYAQGHTPNPDVMCNREIKFGVFLKRALAAGADYMATGHYVRVVPPPAQVFAPQKFRRVRSLKGDIPKIKLLKGKDRNKDQSYFLWTLTQEQLRHCLFPIGDYTKPEVRAIARTLGLPTAEKPDSQGICFIGEIDLREFLKRYIPKVAGQVVTTSGRVVGAHEGLSFYTIGERHGLGIGGGIPYYVAEKDLKTNTLLVAEGPYDEKLFSRRLVAADVNWISGNPPAGGFPLRCEARIRYRQPTQSCRIEKSETRNPKSETWKVIFDEPQRAVTCGQSVVFYRGEELMGGGVIAE